MRDQASSNAAAAGIHEIAFLIARENSPRRSLPVPTIANPAVAAFYSKRQKNELNPHQLIKNR